MTNKLLCLTCFILALFALAATTTRAQGTAFTYQGRLAENGVPASGIYDLRLTIHDALSAGNAIGSIVTNSATSVSNGLFTVALDFGAGVFDGNARWLEIAVRTNGGAQSFVSLSPRQRITATPYALRASQAALVPGVQVNTNLFSTALGFNTLASSLASTAMGNGSAAEGNAATALGQSTTASGAASLASGQESVASGENATALGFQTTASGAGATSLGQSTTARGFNSFAAGTVARANHDGSFVWADYNYVDFASTATNQFLIRAAGGVGINTNNPHGAALAVNGVIAGDGSGLTNLSLSALASVSPLDVVTSAPLASPLQYPTGGTSPSSVAVGDVNGDGRADLAVANAGSGTVTILINTGAGFALAGTIIARAGAEAVLLADINRDGHLDVLCANSDHSIAVARNLGNGSFNTATFHASTPAITRLAVGDLNGDTWPDLVAGARNTNVVPVFLNNGAGSFPANPSSLFTTAPNPAGVALAEVTGDLNLDLITGHGSPLTAETNVAVYPGNGSGGFTAPIAIGTGTGLKAVAIVDMNLDGKKDIVVGMGQSGARIDIFTNSGQGNFTLRQTLPTAYVDSLTVGDFNDDGRPDVAVRDGGFFGATGMRAMLSDNTGRLAQGFYLNPFSYASVAAGDLDGDGQSELIAPNGGNPGLVNVFTIDPIPGVLLTGPTTLRGPLVIEQPAAFSAGFTAGGHSTFSDVAIGGALSFGAATRQMINLYDTYYGIGVQNSRLYFRTAFGANDGFAWFKSGTHSNTPDDPGVGGSLMMSLNPNRMFVNTAVGLGTTNPQAGLHLYSTSPLATMRLQSAAQPGAGRIEFLSDPQGSANEWRPGYIQSTDNGGFTGGLSFVVNGTGFANRFAEVETMRVVNGRVGIGTPTPATALHVIGTVTATTFNPPSDRHLKENFTPVNSREVLEKVSALTISGWNFKDDGAARHMGPMAQDFHAAFGLGTDDRHIATVDADGVALAAIQGLNQKLEEQRAENAKLKERLARIERLMSKLTTEGN